MSHHQVTTLHAKTNGTLLKCTTYVTPYHVPKHVGHGSIHSYSHTITYDQTRWKSPSSSILSYQITRQNIADQSQNSLYHVMLAENIRTEKVT